MKSFKFLAAAAMVAASVGPVGELPSYLNPLDILSEQVSVLAKAAPDFLMFETLASLEEALNEFTGCAVITSHDRFFLDRVATHILAWEGTDENPGNWYWYEGNFEAYQENRVARLGVEAAKPHRVHRKLTRD